MNADCYSDAELKSCLQSLGIEKGDCLFVHSSLKPLGKFVPARGQGDLAALLDVFLDTIGEAGTFVVPTFNFGFCRGQPFDRQNTPSDGMGAFSEFIRRQPRALRSQHPFQCVSAIGKFAAEVASAQGRSAFSPGSAFDVMLKHGCKILFFGVYFVETFVHVAEERAHVPYRFWKTFTGDFIDWGVSNHVAIEFFARKLDLAPEPLIDNEKLGRVLRKKGIITSASLGSGHVSICNASNLVDELTDRLIANPSFGLRVGERGDDVGVRIPK